MKRYPIPQPIIDSIKNLDETGEKIISTAEFAKQDYIAALNFLKQYDGNQATFESYRREIERILQWSWLVANKSILKLKQQDVKDYIEFCLNPPLTWIGVMRVTRFIERGGIRQPNPRWRPFVSSVTKQDNKRGAKPSKHNYRLSQGPKVRKLRFAATFPSPPRLSG